MSADAIAIPAPVLRDFAAAMLHKGGFSREEAEITAESLVLSDMLGYHSHGVVRVAEYLECLNDTNETISGVTLSIERETATSLHADAGRGLGQVQMPRLLDLLCGKAAQNAVVTGALKNCGHTGRLGEWVERIAAKGYAAFIACNDNGVYRVVAPPGGKQACTSTNPVAFAIPLPAHDFFAIDLSTSAVAAGKIRVAYLAGENCAPGLIQDHEGKPTTDPARLFKEPQGTLLPMGGAQGYKGFALSMMVDCLVAGLSGGYTPPAPEDAPLLNNITVTIWNPEYFAGLAHMQTQAARYLDYIRQSAPVDPAKPVRVPGDRARAARKKNEKDGIAMNRAFMGKMAKRAREAGVEIPKTLADL